jgi:hypothetical protein
MVLGDLFFKKREFVTEYSFFKVFVTKWQKFAKWEQGLWQACNCYFLEHVSSTLLPWQL